MRRDSPLFLSIKIPLFAISPERGIFIVWELKNCKSYPCKIERLAACDSQTASPFGCLNHFPFEILSNFWGALP